MFHSPAFDHVPWIFPCSDASSPTQKWQLYIDWPAKLGSETKFGTWVMSCCCGFQGGVPPVKCLGWLINHMNTVIQQGSNNHWLLKAEGSNLGGIFTYIRFGALYKGTLSPFWMVNPPLLMVPCLPLRLKYPCLLVIFTTVWCIQPWRYSLMVNWGDHPSFWDRQEETWTHEAHHVSPSLGYVPCSNDLKSAHLAAQCPDSWKCQMVDHVSGGFLHFPMVFLGFCPRFAYVSHIDSFGPAMPCTQLATLVVGLVPFVES